MTEDDAKTKWCPMYQVSGADGYNNRDDVPGYPKCIASDCMMWRTTVICMSDDPEILNDVRKDGYCGLGGGL